MSNPYKSRPAYAFWSSEVATLGAATMPHLPYPAFITKQMRIGTAGSCFAQHIARRLAASGYQFHVEEKAPFFLSDELAQAFGYGMFSARYGNIYTVRQLLQLVERAEGSWDPGEAPWLRGDRFIDPFRPTATPHGHATPGDVLAEQRRHLDAVRRLFRTLDVFVFTLGLTECWLSRTTGAALPVCPGTSAGGRFDPEAYRFENFDFEAVHSDLKRFIGLVHAINPRLRLIFTVSPVPLVATMETHSVLTATTYSKSVLRAVVGDVERAYDFVHYFPSYEIITGAFSRGRYFAEDLRSIQEQGVDHVMRLFFQSVCLDGDAPAKPTKAGAAARIAKPALLGRNPRAGGARVVPNSSSKAGAATGSRSTGAAPKSDDFVDIVCDEMLLQYD